MVTFFKWLSASTQGGHGVQTACNLRCLNFRFAGQHSQKTRNQRVSRTTKFWYSSTRLAQPPDVVATAPNFFTVISSNTVPRSLTENNLVTSENALHRIKKLKEARLLLGTEKKQQHQTGRSSQSKRGRTRAHRFGVFWVAFLFFSMEH